MIEWNKYVDKIYVISYTKNFDKRKRINKEFERIGITEFEYVYSIDSSLIKNFDEPFIDSDIENYNHFKYVSFTHYETIKKSYELGYKRILIFEDNIYFLKDINEIKNQLDKFYNNGDIVKFDYVNIGDYGYISYLSSAYLLSYNGMKKLIEDIENKFWVIDFYFKHNKNIQFNVINYLNRKENVIFPELINTYDLVCSDKRICIQLDNDKKPIDFYNSEQIKDKNINIDEYYI